jgi:hypothetical protein
MMIGLGCTQISDAAEPSTRPATGPAGAPVVIELFTSEGCSSCPPADDLLADLIGEAQSHAQPVYAMAFHVGYWDRLGWRDPFSAGEFTVRQRRYATAFGTDQVYTPQMVINGKSGFVGSDGTEARKQIRAAMTEHVATELAMKPEKGPNGRLTIACTLADAPKGSLLNVALVERSVTTHVQRGENAGRTLRHCNVVRAFGTAMLSDRNTATIELKPPASLDPKNAMLIGFLQDGKSMSVLGASTADFLP